MRNFFLFLIISIAMLQSCGTSSNVTSNFSIQKRKYNKGWNVKDLFQHKQNRDAAEFELKKKNQDQEPVLVENDKLKTEHVHEIRTEQTENEIRLNVSEIREKAEIGDFEVNRFEDELINNFPLSDSNQDRIVHSEKNNVATSTMTDENATDSLFRVFYTMGFVLVIITVILSLLQFTGDIALIFLMLLFLFDVASIIVFIICLVRRVKNPEKYKEKAWLVIVTELLLGAASFLALLTWGIFNY
ncbi:MAG: hypothetical protein RI922_107 [Bacteroidota bacterium]|jgi:hypothetical protein